MTIKTEQPSVIQRTILAIQVCVPEDWIDEQIREFAEREERCGTTAGWGIRKDGNPRLDGTRERICCDTRDGFVHVILEA